MWTHSNKKKNSQLPNSKYTWEDLALSDYQILQNDPDVLQAHQ